VSIKEKLEQKIGEALGLEMAAQKAVDELSAKGLLDEAGMKSKLQTMRKQANRHQTDLELLVQKLSKSEGLDSETIQESANETEQKASQMMQTYLGDQPDASEAIEFLCLAEGGEVSHYEVLSAFGRKVKDKKFAARVKSILTEERRHLQLCTQLAKKVAIQG
jgi:hypothetical protein